MAASLSKREEGTPPPSPVLNEETSPSANGNSRKRPSSAGKRGEKRPKQSYETPKGVFRVLSRKSEARRKALAKEVSDHLFKLGLLDL